MHVCGIDGCKEERLHRASLSRHRGEVHGVEEVTDGQLEVATSVSPPAPAPPTFSCHTPPTPSIPPARNIPGHRRALDVESSFRSRDRNLKINNHTWRLASTRPFDAPSSISTGLYRHTQDHVERLPRVVPAPHHQKPDFFSGRKILGPE